MQEGTETKTAHGFWQELGMEFIGAALIGLFGLFLINILGLSQQLGQVLVLTILLLVGLLLVFIRHFRHIAQSLATVTLTLFIIIILINALFIWQMFKDSKTVQIQALSPYIIPYGGDYDELETTGGSSRFSIEPVNNTTIAYT